MVVSARTPMSILLSVLIKI
ncbi:hypothetical protein LINPERHAP1_LOCUS37850 [Linum perenne]